MKCNIVWVHYDKKKKFWVGIGIIIFYICLISIFLENV
jgi:hypothetical protein